MTVDGIREIVRGIDPNAKHYYTALDGGSYTVWQETKRIYLPADDDYVEQGWQFRIVRYTQNEYDDMPNKIEAELRENARVTFEYRVNVNPETGYVSHEFNCEAM